MKLILIKSGQQIDITKFVGNLARSDNVDSITMEFSFDSMINPDDALFAKVDIAVGDKLLFMNNERDVFQGIITEESWNGKYQRSYKAYDYGFYLNKNEVAIQFNSIAAEKAITKLCGDFGIAVGDIVSIPTSIKKIYNGEALSDCIKDILKQATQETGQKYRMEIRESKLYVEKQTDLMVTAIYQPAANLTPFDATKAPAEVSGSRSIENMANAIKIVSGSEKSIQVIVEEKNQQSIEQFGLLQKVESVEEKDIAKARTIAKNTLKDLGKIVEASSIELLGDDTVRSGRLLEINQPQVGMKGTYLITSCTHNYKNENNHSMKLDLEAI